MKRIKTIAAIAFMIGFVLILSEAGADDLMTELHQEHAVNTLKMLFGLLLCLPLPLVMNHGS